MIILRKDQLQVAPVESEIFNSRPAAFDFEKDGDSAQSVVNILFDRSLNQVLSAAFFIYRQC